MIMKRVFIFFVKDIGIIYIFKIKLKTVTFQRNISHIRPTYFIYEQFFIAC